MAFNKKIKKMLIVRQRLETLNGCTARGSLSVIVCCDVLRQVPGSLGTILTASLFLRSNLTFRVENGATLLGTATGDGKTPQSINDAPIVYARRNAIMTCVAGHEVTCYSAFVSWSAIVSCGCW
jgi:polygalacturonase